MIRAGAVFGGKSVQKQQKEEKAACRNETASMMRACAGLVGPKSVNKYCTWPKHGRKYHELVDVMRVLGVLVRPRAAERSFTRGFSLKKKSRRTTTITEDSPVVHQ